MARTKMNVRQQQFGFPDEDLKVSLHDEIVLWLKDNAVEVAKKLTGWTEDWDAKLIEGERTRFTQQVEQRKKILEEDLIRENLWRRFGDGELFYQVDKRARLNSMRDHLVTLKSWPGLGEPPLREIDVSSACEVPIKRERYKTTDIIGYADIVFTIRLNQLKTPSFQADQFGNHMLDNNELHWWSHWGDPFKVGLDAKTTIPSFGQIVRDLNTYREFCDWPFVVVSPEARFAQALADEGYGFIQYPDGVFLRPRWHRKN
jgi:hypothetical protein